MPDSIARLLLLTCAAAACLASPARAQGPGGPEAADAVLDKVLETYRAATAITDTLHIESVVGGVNEEVDDRHVRFGPGNESLVTTKLNDLISTGGRYYVTSSRIPDKYVDVPLQVDPLQTLASLGSPQRLIPYALRYDDDRTLILRALSLGMPGVLEPSRVLEARGPDGRDLLQVTFVNTEGYLRLDVDPNTWLIRAAHSDHSPTDAPVGNFHIVGKVTFNTRILDELPEPVTFDPRGRTAVTSFAAMLGQTTKSGEGAPGIKVGDPAPVFALYTLEGVKFDSTELAGKAYVLDFWAAWCLPCRKTLAESAKLAEWAKTETRVRIIPINALERGPDPGSRWDRAHTFWEEQGFQHHSLFDMDGKVAERFGVKNLPATVIVGPDGKVAEVLTGVDDGRATQIRKRLAQLIAEP